MISVIVVNHNGGSTIDRCLASVGGGEQSGLEVIVADNASADGSREHVAERYPAVRLLRLDSNLGFGAANNAAAAHAAGESLLLLNQDAWLLPGCLSELARCLERDARAGLVAPRLELPDGGRQFVWVPGAGLLAELAQRLRNPWVGWSLAHEPLQFLLHRVCGIGWFTAACVLVRRRAFDQVEGFDPGFFLYFEDTDLCLRLRRAGWRLAYARAARAVHDLRPFQLGGTRELAYRRGQLRLYQRHRPGYERSLLRAHLARKYAATRRPDAAALRALLAAEAGNAEGER